jgi:hypothetical protein
VLSEAEMINKVELMVVLVDLPPEEIAFFKLGKKVPIVDLELPSFLGDEDDK